ncbi:MAG TPA: type II secretion system protein GspG [bacterium]|nr:type II secretion system protein GspG [bacterium]
MAKFKAPAPPKTWRDYLRDRRFTVYPLAAVAALAITAFLMYVNIATSGGFDLTPVAHDFATAMRQLERFRTDHGRYPTTAEGLAVLTTERAAADSQPYLATPLAAPGGLAYQYAATDTVCRITLTYSGREYGVSSTDDTATEQAIYRLLAARR